MLCGERGGTQSGEGAVHKSGEERLHIRKKEPSTRGLMDLDP